MTERLPLPGDWGGLRRLFISTLSKRSKVSSTMSTPLFTLLILTIFCLFNIVHASLLSFSFSESCYTQRENNAGPPSCGTRLFLQNFTFFPNPVPLAATAAFDAHNASICSFRSNNAPKIFFFHSSCKKRENQSKNVNCTKNAHFPNTK